MTTSTYFEGSLLFLAAWRKRRQIYVAACQQLSPAVESFGTTHCAMPAARACDVCTKLLVLRARCVLHCLTRHTRWVTSLPAASGLRPRSALNNAQSVSMPYLNTHIFGHHHAWAQPAYLHKSLLRRQTKVIHAEATNRASVLTS